MEQFLNQTTSLLARTPATLNALLRDLPEYWTLRNEGENTFTPLDVVGHLLHGDRANWIPRVRMILQYGESRPFEPFDRRGHERDLLGKSLPQLLDDFASVRAENLRELDSLRLQPADLNRCGRHPALGAVNLTQLLATWAAHDLTHLHQLSRVMAHQYRQAVGPWSAYLGVLQCQGHSASS